MTDTDVPDTPLPDTGDLPLVAFGGIPLYVGHVGWSDDLPVVTSAHRHPHAELSIAVGRARLTLDFDELDVEGVTGVLIGTGVVHQWHVTEPFELWVIGTSAGAVDDDGTVERLLGAGPVRVPEDDVDDLLALVRLAKRRFEEQPTEPGRAATYVRALHLQLADWSGVAPTDRAEDLVGRFTTAMNASPRRRSVSELAAELGVSAGHLSSVVKERTGRTPKQLLTDRSVLEAKRLLANTTESAAAIAHHLGFADASQFGRFFRDHADQTPGEFRRSLTILPDADERR